MTGAQPYETFQRLVETGGIERTNTLLCAASDGFANRARPTAGEMQQFAALAQRLFPAASVAARARAALALGRSQNLSPELEVLVVDNLEGRQLAEFLGSIRRVSQASMLSVLGTDDSAACAALARRADLPDTVIDRLFLLNSRTVYRALAANGSITPRGKHLGALARAAQMDDQIATSLATRTDLDAALLAGAFFRLGERDRIKVVSAFADRATPTTPILHTLEQISVATDELTRALVKLLSEDRRPEIAHLVQQITGLDETRSAQIAGDTAGAALFVVLRAFGCGAQDGLRVLIHASAPGDQQSRALSQFARMFESISIDAAAFLMSAWRGEVNLLDLTMPEYCRGTRQHPSRLAARAG